MILEDPDEEDEEAFLEGEEDEVDEDEQLILNGPDFNAIDNAFQQGLDGQPPENVSPSCPTHRTAGLPCEWDHSLVRCDVRKRGPSCSGRGRERPVR